VLKVSLRQLEKQALTLSGELPAAELELPEEPGESFGPVHYELSVARIVGGVLVRGRLSVAVHGPCGRCLREFDYLLTPPEVCHLYEQVQGEELDLAPELREDLLIALPMKRLCREDCRGLCPVCGGDRNRRSCRCALPGADPDRWAALDSLSER